MQAVSIHTGCLDPHSKLEDIKGQLLSLHGKSALQRFADNIQDGGDVSGLLGDLQEAVNDYMVCL